MKIVLKILIILTINFSPLLYAQNNDGLVFNKISHDFGKARQYDLLKTIFFYTNKGTNTLEIIKVHVGCGCTASEVSKKVLKQNEYGELAVTLNTGAFSGSVTKFLRVETSPPVPLGNLSIHADVMPALYLDPPEIINLTLSDNLTVKQTVKILSEQYTNFQIQEISYDKKSIEVKSDKYISSNKNICGYILEITLFPDKIKEKTELSNFTEYIKIRTGHEEMTQDFNFYITGSIK